MRSRINLTTITILIITLTSLFAVTGCSVTGHPETFGAGLAAGSALTHTLDGAQRDLEEQQARQVEKQREIVEQMELVTSDAEKEMLYAKNEALKKEIERTATMSTGVKIADKAAETDWKDPEAVAPWLISILTTTMWGVKERKNISIGKLLKAYQEGIEKFKAQANPTQAEKLYADIKERKAKLKV